MDQPQALPFSESIGRLAELIAEHHERRLDADMEHVLDLQAGMGARQMEFTDPRGARQQPSLEEAQAEILRRQGREPDGFGVIVGDDTIEGPDGEIALRIFKPAPRDNKGPAPLILYLHDGLWVSGDLSRVDAVPRMLARRTGAVVVAAGYAQAPEKRFPAAHEDAWAAWAYMNAKAFSLGGDHRLMALVGEGAGANLALNIALKARDERRRTPLHMVLVSPVASSEAGRNPDEDTVRARPVSAATLRWAARHAFENPEDADDPRIDLAKREDLWELPPTTLILADADPLRAEGEALGQALEAAGNAVEMTLYAGAAHGFFALGAVVNKAMLANSQAATALNAAFILGRVPRG